MCNPRSVKKERITLYRGYEILSKHERAGYEGGVSRRAMRRCVNVSMAFVYGLSCGRKDYSSLACRRRVEQSKEKDRAGRAAARLVTRYMADAPRPDHRTSVNSAPRTAAPSANAVAPPSCATRVAELLEKGLPLPDEPDPVGSPG